MNGPAVRNVLVIDSDPSTSLLVQETLGARFSISVASSMDEGLALATDLLPCMVIAATQGHELDGFKLCRRIKDEIDEQDIPVLLLADDDSSETRLRGFDAGAVDCIFRPINPKRLAVLLASVVKQYKKRTQLQERAQHASSFALTAMTSLSEIGLVIEGIKHFNQCDTGEELARATLESVAMFKLHGAVELLMGEQSFVMNRDGSATEMERSILQRLSSMDRIVQFKNRLFIRYPRVRIVINNLPIDDPDKCGRLRDHLVMMVEAADTRVGSLMHASTSHSRGAVISSTIQSLTSAMSGIDLLQRQGRIAATSIRADVVMEMEQTLAIFGLTEAQEVALLSIVQRGFEALGDFQLAEAHLQDELSGAIAELQRVAAASA